jgi:hypothetical protein
MKQTLRQKITTYKKGQNFHKGNSTCRCLTRQILTNIPEVNYSRGGYDSVIGHTLAMHKPGVQSPALTLEFFFFKGARCQWLTLIIVAT